MSHGPFWIRRPGPARLARLLQEQSTEQLTYSEVGATAGELPSDYHPVRASITVGRGGGVFERASEALRAWAPQRAAGFDFVPVRPPLEVGQSLVLAFRSFPFFVTGAARVVYVVDRRGSVSASPTGPSPATRSPARRRSSSSAPATVK